MTACEEFFVGNLPQTMRHSFHTLILSGEKSGLPPEERTNGTGEQYTDGTHE